VTNVSPFKLSLSKPCPSLFERRKKRAAPFDCPPRQALGTGFDTPRANGSVERVLV
jgi:hypothetical protein